MKKSTKKQLKSLCETPMKLPNILSYFMTYIFEKAQSSYIQYSICQNLHFMFIIKSSGFYIISWMGN